MKLNCHKIKILNKTNDHVKVEFLDSEIVMPIEKSVIESKIKNQFYQVVA